MGALDGAGAVVATQRYWPYGATRSGGVTQTDKLYTGQQAEPGDALGLYNYRARFYSTVVGRFVSGDPVSIDGVNRYGYAGGNPVSFIDPTGYCFTFPGNGEQFRCEGSDAEDWMRCVMECGDNWIGAIARYGIGQLDYWANVRLSDNPLTAGRVLLAFVESFEATPSKWHLMPDAGWLGLSSHFGVSVEFFRDSLWGLVFGTLPVRGPSAGIIGAYEWWNDAGHFGYEFASLVLDDLHRHFRHESAVRNYILAETVDYGRFVGNSQIAQIPEPWSIDQQRILGAAGFEYRVKQPTFDDVFTSCLWNPIGCPVRIPPPGSLW